MGLRSVYSQDGSFTGFTGLASFVGKSGESLRVCPCFEGIAFPASATGAFGRVLSGLKCKKQPDLPPQLLALKLYRLYRFVKLTKMSVSRPYQRI